MKHPHSPLRLATAGLVMGLTVFAANVGAQPNPDRGIVTGTARASGTSVRYGTASVDLDFPLSQVEAMMHGYASYQDFLPHFRTSRVLSQRGHRALMYVEVMALHDTITLWAQVRISSRERNGTRVIRATLTEGNMDAFDVQWELSAIDDQHTHVEFRLLADPDLPLPSSVITTENERFARLVCRAMRQRLESTHP